MQVIGSDPPGAAQIQARHERLLARLRDAAAANGHDPGRLRIVAITKTHPVELVRAAVDAGLTRLGENRIQEAEPKIAAITNVEWHLVGHLQSNKVRRAVRAFDVIHSIDSAALLRRVATISGEEARHPSLLLQVNVSAEDSKAGIALAEATAADVMAAMRETGPAGLMTIAPMGASVEEARAIFSRLRNLRDHLEQATGLELPELSMGMSADAEAAAAEGATMIRIGTAIFGPRA